MKYGNHKTEVDGLRFDSKKEAVRWAELKLLERAGEIFDLQMQVPFVLIPVQRDETGKVIEREVKYIADFTYRDRKTGRLTVEDVKSPATKKNKEYIIKRKLMMYRHGLRIKEI